MLNEHQINFLPERIAQRISDINSEYLENIGTVIKKIGELRPKDVHQLQRMYNYGADMEKVIAKLSSVSGKNVQEIYDIFNIVAKENYDYAEPFYKAQGLKFIPYEDNESLQRYVNSLAKQTVDEYINITQHTAFAVFAKDGKSIAPLFEANKNKLATPLSDTYTKLVDYAVTKVQLGEESYTKAMRDVIKGMVNSGIKTVDYATGYSRSIESAVRQNILWGVKQCNQNTADMIGEDFGADGYEVDYHSNPRPSHADMGGKQFAKGPARTVKGVYYPSFEEMAEPLLNEYGCLHFKFSILLGISVPAHTKQQLEEFKARDKQTFEFEGHKYTAYEGKQLQGRIESAVKYQKDLANTAKKAGDDDLRREAQYNINVLTNKYAKLSEASGLPTRMERLQMGGFKPVKTVDKSVKSGIIKSNDRLSELGRFKERIRNDKEMSKEYYATVKEKFSHGSDIAKAAFNKFVPEGSVADAAFEGIARYSTTTKKISMHYGADLINPRGSCITYFHEHAHLIDDMAGNLSKSKEFKELLMDDALSYRKTYGKAHGLKTFSDVDNAISAELNSMRKHSGVSDILEGITGGNIHGVAGHGNSYWQQEGNIEAEAFAHMFASQFDGVRYTEMKKYFPNALKWFENKLKEAVK